MHHARLHGALLRAEHLLSEWGGRGSEWGGSGSKWAPESGGVTADVSSIKGGSCDIIEEGVGWLG